MPVFNNALAGAAGSGGDASYKIEQSLRFERTQNSYLQRTFKGGERKKWTWSGWIKRAKTEDSATHRVFRANPSGGESGIHLASNNRIEVYHYAGGGYVYQVVPTFKLKDEAAWYHVLVSVDTTIASPASDRVKVWINGDRKTEITTASYPSQNFESFINDNNAPTAIGGSDLKYDGLMAEIHFLDGIAVTDASGFGAYNEKTGVWDPIEYTGNHNGGVGVNGFYLDFDPTAGVVYSDSVLNAANNSADNMFDGSLSSYTEGDTNGTAVTWSGNISGSTIEFYAAQNSGTRTFSVNGVDRLSLVPTSPGWFTIPNTTSLTAISFSRGAPSGGFVDVYAIRVDGKIVTDHSAPGADKSGNLNHFAPTNFSMVSAGNGDYIGNLTSNGTNTYTQDNANFLKSFDNNLNTEWLLARSNTVVDGTINFPGGYTMQDANNGLRIYTGASWYISSFLYRKYYSVNGGSYTMIGSTSDTNGVGAPKRWVTIPVPGGTLNSLSVRTHSDNGSWGSGFASAIELDGVILTDNSIVTSYDSFIDTPTDYDDRGNYCVINPKTVSAGTFDKANLGYQGPGAYKTAFGTIGASSGKWYYEAEVLNAPYGQAINDDHNGFGWGTYLYDSSSSLNAMTTNLLYADTGWYINFSTTKTNSNQSINAGDYLSVAVDLDAWTFEYRRNGTAIATGTIGGTPGSFLYPCITSYNGSYGQLTYNFGQRPFKYAPGSTGGPAAAYKALCTTNLPDPTLDKPSTAFTTRTYTGKGDVPNPIGGPVYSNQATGGSSLVSMFDGSVSSWNNLTAGNTITFTPSPAIACTQLELWLGTDTPIRVNVNGGGYGSTFTQATLGYVDITPSGGMTSLTSLLIDAPAGGPGSGAGIRGLRINGTTVIVDGQGAPTEFKPGLAWLKARNSTHYHFLHDDVRGSTKALYSNQPDAQYNYKPSGITSFDDTGFTVKGAYAANYVNTGYTAWLWNMGTYNNTFDPASYNQDQVWSTGVSGSNQVPNNQGFDGDLSTWAAPNGNSVLTWTPSYTLSVSSSMRVYAAREANGDSITVYFTDGTSFNAFTPDNVFRWYTVTSPAGKTIDRMEWSHSTSKSKVSAIEIDGKILVDAGYVAAGSLNSAAYNMGTIWSTGVASSGGAWPGGFNIACGHIDNGFNAELGNGVCASGGSNIVWTNPESTSTLTGTLEFYNRADTTTYSRTAIVTHAGGTTSAITLTANSVWQNLGTYTGITAITITGNNPGGGVIDAIRVNGKILVDSNKTPANVPSVSAAVKANQTAGMSMVTYTATGSDLTAPHGLLKKPEFIILKSYDENSRDWLTMFSAVGETEFMKLNTHDQSTGASNVWLGTTSTTFKTGNDAGINTNKEPKIAYCFHSVPGVCKIGTYMANGSAADGPFVDVGFKPAFLMHKRYNAGGANVGDWRIWDAARDPDNPLQGIAIPNGVVGDAINSAHNVEFMSNGFRIITADTNINANNGQFAYIAFAENPFKYSRGR